MSSKPGSKTLKRTGSVLKKKAAVHSGTPEHSVRDTPTDSRSSMGQGEGPSEQSTVDAVLRGEDVQALLVTEENLKKLHASPTPPSRGRPEEQAAAAAAVTRRRVVVKRAHTADDSTTLKHRGVAVLRPLPPGATVTATKTLGSPEAGPRFDHEGTFLQHSVLGSTTHFSHQLKSTGMVESTSMFHRPPPVVLPDIATPPPSDAMSYQKTIVPREEHALEQWNRNMELRKSQQEYLAGQLKSTPEKLAMNQGDNYRALQEERMLIDRAMPSVNYGKGYRVGSEFWSQNVKIGSDCDGINTTLTCTEKGLPPELQFVGIPSVVQSEKGVVAGIERNAPLHYTGKPATYLSTRRQELQEALRDIEPFRPDVLGLQVVGHAPGPAAPPASGRASGRASGPRVRRGSLDSLGEGGVASSSSSEEEEEEGGAQSSVLDLLPVLLSEPVIGPAMRVGGRLLRWEGPPCSTSDASEPLELRVVFESNTGDISTAHLDLENCGTAAVYYSWLLVPKDNPLGTIQAGDTQRFYFDTRGGVLLPGQSLAFPFFFKSPNAGVFSEAWSLQTGPLLAGGRPVRLTLKGVAVQEDINAHKREELELLLRHRMAVAVSERLVNTIVDTIRTPLSSPEPPTTQPSEESVFQVQNPGVFFHYNVVQQLKALYTATVQQPESQQEAELLTAEASKSSKKEEKAKKPKKESADTKKGHKVKDESIKDVIPDDEVLRTEEAIPQVPAWDLSIASLQEAIVGLEDDSGREEKLQQLSQLVGALSFPPPRHRQRQHYNICYESLCEAVDGLVAVSNHLCTVMGLPLRECAPISGKLSEEELTTPSVPSSPAPGKKDKDKKGGKDARKTDAKVKTTGRERAGSSSKTKLASKKSKLSMKETLSPEHAQTDSPAPTVAEVDPVLEKKYRDNFYAIVYDMLGSTADKVAALFEEV